MIKKQMLSLQCGLSIGDWRLFSWNWRMSAWCSVNSIPILISATNTIKVLRRSTLKKHQLAFKDNIKNLLPIATWDRKLSSTDAAILRSTWKQGRTRKTIMHSSSTSALVSAKNLVFWSRMLLCVASDRLWRSLRACIKGARLCCVTVR